MERHQEVQEEDYLTQSDLPLEQSIMGGEVRDGERGR